MGIQTFIQEILRTRSLPYLGSCEIFADTTSHHDVTEWADGIVQIMHAEEYRRPDYNEMLSLAYGLMSKYNVDSVYIDGANPSFIKSLKLQIGEDADYDKVIARYRSEGLGDSWSKDMKIIPVNFNKEHKVMLGHCKMIFEKDGGRIAINPDRFDKLITALRTAVDNDGTLDKESTSYNDILMHLDWL